MRRSQGVSFRSDISAQLLQPLDSIAIFDLAVESSRPQHDPALVEDHNHMHKTPVVDVVFLAVFLVAGTRAYAAGFPVQQVDAVLGRSAQQLPGSVYKYSWPRSDLKVKVAGTPIAPGLALGSWAAFAPRTDNTWGMRDLVLLQSETVPVIDKLQAGGFRSMGGHNHRMNEVPRGKYVHSMRHTRA